MSGILSPKTAHNKHNMIGFRGFLNPKTTAPTFIAFHPKKIVCARNLEPHTTAMSKSPVSDCINCIDIHNNRLGIVSESLSEQVKTAAVNGGFFHSDCKFDEVVFFEFKVADFYIAAEKDVF